MADAWEQGREAINGCLAAGVREFVVCGGARNAVLVELLARAEVAGRVTLRRHFEERGAGFFALGRTLASGEPCAVVTTSGTAAAELLPAMIEAHYQGRPLVALTADRPERFRGTGAPQAIEQVGIFGPHAGTGEWAEWDRRSPWHLNVAIEEEFEPGEVEWVPEKLRQEPEWPRLAVAGLARWLKDDLFRGLVLMIGELEAGEREEVFHFALDLGVPVVAEATSGLREALVALQLPDPDRMLHANPPGKVLRLGGVPSGRFWRDLEELGETEVWNVTRSGFPGLARDCLTTEAPVGKVIRALGEVDEAGDALDLLTGASRRQAEIDELLEAYPDSEPGMMRTLSLYASLSSSVYLGNSLPIREWNLFAQHERAVPEVRASRGANGIDGQLSTWLGWTADDADPWCIVGDLTALYDLAAPAMLSQVSRRRSLVVINNGGGEIFARLPRLATMNPRARELMVNPHQRTLEGWASMWGMDYLAIRSTDDFDALESGEGPRVVEVFPDAKETAAFLERWDELGGG